MTKDLNNKPHSIIQIKCSSCHMGVIYLKVLNHRTNTKPFNPKDHKCTECSQLSATANQAVVVTHKPAQPAITPITPIF